MATELLIQSKDVRFEKKNQCKFAYFCCLSGEFVGKNSKLKRNQ